MDEERFETVIIYGFPRSAQREVSKFHLKMPLIKLNTRLTLM